MNERNGERIVGCTRNYKDRLGLLGASRFCGLPFRRFAPCLGVPAGGLEAFGLQVEERMEASCLSDTLSLSTDERKGCCWFCLLVCVSRDSDRPVSSEV